MKYLLLSLLVTSVIAKPAPVQRARHVNVPNRHDIDHSTGTETVTVTETTESSSTSNATLKSRVPRPPWVNLTSTPSTTSVVWTDTAPSSGISTGAAPSPVVWANSTTSSALLANTTSSNIWSNTTFSSAALINASSSTVWLRTAPSPAPPANTTSSSVFWRNTTSYQRPPSGPIPVPPLLCSSSPAAPSLPTGSNGTALVTGTTASTGITASTGVPSPSDTLEKVKFGGINMAGFDFGCQIDGSCPVGSALDIVTKGNAVRQMNHFVERDGLNAFRLPVAWQYLVNNNLGGILDARNFGKYNALVQGCLSAGASMCIVDIHNYARWNGGIIGQGGPTNDQFNSLWSQLATEYGMDTRIAFGLMNEPHDLNVTTWVDTVQSAVTAIRETGAQNTILLPGTHFTNAAAMRTSGGGPELLKVTNPDGSTDNLVLDVHQYLDYDSSGTNAGCASNHINDAFAPLADFLRSAGRQAMLTETGGGNTPSCEQYLYQELDYLNKNSDIYLGFTTWGAGGFSTSYTLTETPVFSGDSVTDQPLVSKCIVPAFKGSI